MKERKNSLRRYGWGLLVIGTVMLLGACNGEGPSVGNGEGPSVGMAMESSPLPGKWEGSIETPSAMLAVNLTIGEMKFGAKGTVLRFGSPRSCTLEAEFSGEKGDTEVFSFTGSTGGYCDKYFPGTLAVRQSGGDRIHFETHSPSEASVDEGELKRAKRGM